MIKRCIAALMLFLFASLSFADDSAVLKAVESSARTWLALTDEEHYADSWKMASSHFQNKRSEADWIKTAGTIRKPLGAMENRYIATAGYSKEPSGFPEGEYVVLQFYATFKNRTLALETVTLSKDKDSEWRVADYAIK
ncbi:MAG: DUF4019 domain-containing protein [Nitrosomonas sp.]|nr:DUF4019 domain-containing protein [Nitrosomonas sp.]